MSGVAEDRLRDAIRTIQRLRGQLEASQAERYPPLAVVGMGCRLAGAETVEQFWRLLAAGRDAIGPVPPDRWDRDRWYSADPEAPGRVSFDAGGFLADVDGFDNDLFGLAAREAEMTDPQQRLLLEVVWEALEDALIAPQALRGSATGVFLGLNSADHLQAVLSAPDDLGSHALMGGVASVAAGRIAYTLGLVGPAMVVDTACSSSLVALHLAMRSLQARDCDLALAGGAHLMLTPNVSVALSRARMMAPDGRSRAFDAAAAGFGQGEGCGVVVLKRLADAEAAGDPILAVLRGAAVNQDGRSAGLSAPNGRSQEAVIRHALAQAGLAPEAVDAIEAHGTGTALGDPIEMHALRAVFGGKRAAPLRVGSVKTNIGHTAAAAGIAGVIKAVLMLRHQAVPASLHFDRLNPHIDLGDAAIAVPTALTAAPLRAIGVSSFGFSGTNAHVVVQSAPASAERAAAINANPRLLISARTPAALAVLMERYRVLLAEGEPFADICHSASVGRARLPWWVCVGSADELGRAVPSNAPHPELPPQPGRRVPLPRYPFQRRRFARLTAARPRAATASGSTGFPGTVLDLPSADRHLVCVLDLRQQPWLADHRVQGHVVVPGAAMIALMMAVSGASTLRDIAFEEAVTLDEGTSIRLVATARADGTVSVESHGERAWRCHASAGIADAAQPALMLPATPRRAPVSRAGWVGYLQRLGIDIGPSFQAIDQLWRGADDSCAAALRIPDMPAVGGMFHPAVLDAVLQVAGGTLSAETVLPIGIAELTIHGPLPDVMSVQARSRAAAGEGVAVDLEASAGGRVLVSVHGLTVRRLAASQALPTIAAQQWISLPASPSTGAPAEVFEVAENGANLPAALAWLQPRLSNPTPIAFVTRGATPPVTDPGSARFIGLASALAAERPDLFARCIDLAPDTPVAMLHDELCRIDGEPVVGLRASGRFVPRLIRVSAGAGSEPTLSGTVLITGGFGGIGRHVAAWAKRRGAEALLLVSRSGGVASWGESVRTLAADIATAAGEAAIAVALADLPPLRTIIHSAGVLRDGLIEHQTAESFSAVLAPKFDGAKALLRLAQGSDLQHLLLFGSVGSVIGAAGQTSYAAANAVLDAYAEALRDGGLPARSILWGSWAGTGMAAGLSAAQTQRVAARGLSGMTPEMALRGLDEALSVDAARVMVARFDWSRATDLPPIFTTLQPVSDGAGDSTRDGGSVAAVVRQILGQDAEPGLPLIACGMDSLMAIDLRNRLNRRFGTGLGLGDLMGGIDVAGLAALVSGAATKASAAEPAAADEEMETLSL